MKLMYQDSERAVGIEVDDGLGFNISQFRDDVLIPLLLAIGYQPATINELFATGEDPTE